MRAVLELFDGLSGEASPGTVRLLRRRSFLARARTRLPLHFGLRPD